MAATNYTPISLYYSSTATNTPSAGNLVLGELAINIADGKLYYKNPSNVVTLLAVSGGAITPITNNGVVYINGSGQAVSGSALTFDGTTLSSASVSYKGSTSGTVTLTAPAVAGTQSYTLPTAVPAANGYALTSTTGGTMSWASVVPGGSTTQVQYNNAGAFGGVSGFTTDGTRVTASTTIGVGGATPSTSGSGITFPATQSASTDVNTLDDYEEGTWTPTDQSGAGLTLTAYPVGRYTKIGRLVHVQCQISYPTTANGSSALIGGLPFPGGPVYYPATVPAIVGGTITSLILVQIDSTPYTNFQPRQDLNNTTYTNAQMSNAIFSLSWSYISP
jgi:hypothetical protein